MTAFILSDNRSADAARFTAEHGLSILLQSKSGNILLDTGASGNLIGNAKSLGIDLAEVDYVFLSHGHADHTGGLKLFLELNHKAKVIISDQVLEVHFYSDRGGLHSITAKLPMELLRDRTIFINESRTIDDDIHVIARIPQVHPLPKGNRHLYKECDGGLIQDDFRHEMALYINGTLFTGCAHNGLENILEGCPWPLHSVIGGFHLLDAKGDDVYESDPALKEMGERLVRNYPDVSFYTSHCTGDKTFSTLKSVLGESLHQFSCGMRLELPDF